MNVVTSKIMGVSQEGAALGDAGADPCLLGIRWQIGNGAQILWRVDIPKSVVAIHKSHRIGAARTNSQLDDVSMEWTLAHVLTCNPTFTDHAIPERLEPADHLFRR